MRLVNSITTNLVALSIRNNLNSSNSNISRALERMSSGLKINCAKDGAAESAIVSKTDVRLSGLDIANQNAMHGANLLNVADSALENMTNKVMRIRDLAFQAINSTYSDDELNAIQTEINQLCDEIKREKEITVYNKKQIFAPSKSEVVEIKPPEKPYAYEVEYLSYPTNSNASQYCIELGSFADYDTIDYTFSSNSNSNKDVLLGRDYSTGFIAFDTDNKISMGYKPTPSVPSFSVSDNITPAQKGDGTKRTLRFEYDFSAYPNSKMAIGGYNANGFTQGKQIYQITCYKDGELVKDFIPVIDKNGKACLYDKVSGQLYHNSGSKDFITGDILPPEESKFLESQLDNSTLLQIGSEAGEDNSINIDLGFNLDEFNINATSINGAKVAIQKCDELMDVFNLRRSQVGSYMNRLDSIVQLQNNEIINLNSKKSIIADTDIAKESSELIKTQILQQVSSSLFSQAHQINANLALRLIGNI